MRDQEFEKRLEIEYLKEQMETAEKESDSITYFKIKKQLYDLQGHW